MSSSEGSGESNNGTVSGNQGVGGQAILTAHGRSHHAKARSTHDLGIYNYIPNDPRAPSSDQSGVRAEAPANKAKSLSATILNATHGITTGVFFLQDNIFMDLTSRMMGSSVAHNTNMGSHPNHLCPQSWSHHKKKRRIHMFPFGCMESLFTTGPEEGYSYPMTSQRQIWQSEMKIENLWYMNPRLLNPIFLCTMHRVSLTRVHSMS